MLRYQESNELHRDFHGGTNLTVDYIAKKYGPNTLKMILRRTGRNVINQSMINLPPEMPLN